MPELAHRMDAWEISAGQACLVAPPPRISAASSANDFSVESDFMSLLPIGLRGLGSSVALSCVGLLAVTGCVSTQHLARVDHERQRLANELVQQEAVGAATQKVCDELAVHLQVAQGQAAENGAWAIGSDAELAKTRMTLVTAQQATRQTETQLQAVRQQLEVAEKAGNEARTQLAGARSRESQLSNELLRTSADLTKLVDVRNKLSANLEAKQGEFQEAMKVSADSSQKQKMELEAADQSLAKLEAARNTTLGQLATVTRRVGELTAKSDGLTAEVAKLKDESTKQVVTASSQLRDVQAALASARQEALAGRVESQAMHEQLARAEQARDEVARKLAASEKGVAMLKVKTVQPPDAAATKPAAETASVKVEPAD